uniref:Uncharacterized protein AlNc14C154G7605 n=1 Tax=Albugo laibachii Nc14 TaxID=890382 RepID=F0WMA0_9STRA|nr:sporangia induced hypothetical protein [Albugo laibachii Nc14]|eukprot:CCA22430.1 sporangia induced hypothetical protein [Albugo laibachii Nc14]
MNSFQRDFDTQDPRQQAQAYIEKHRINAVFEELMAQLLFHQPDNPRQFIKTYLTNAKQNGLTQLLLIQEKDLNAMFTAFDVNELGYVTREQHHEAIKTLGIQPAYNIPEAVTTINRSLFIRNLGQELKKSVE